MIGLLDHTDVPGKWNIKPLVPTPSVSLWIMTVSLEATIMSDLLDDVDEDSPLELLLWQVLVVTVLLLRCNRLTSYLGEQDKVNWDLG